MLVFLLMMGISPTDTIDLCHRLSAKTRLASIEEKLLQQTLTELEAAVRYMYCKPVLCVIKELLSTPKFYFLY